MTATVHLKGGTAIVFDAIQETAHTPRAVLLTLQGRAQGDVVTCALIPHDQVAAVLASLQLVAHSLNLVP